MARTKELKVSVTEIRRAVIKNHGGWEQAADSQILTLWQSLDQDMQKQYIESLKERKVENAVSDEPKKEDQDSLGER
jgi:hypothetical protein